MFFISWRSVNTVVYLSQVGDQCQCFIFIYRVNSFFCVYVVFQANITWRRSPSADFSFICFNRAFKFKLTNECLIQSLLLKTFEVPKAISGFPLWWCQRYILVSQVLQHHPKYILGCHSNWVGKAVFLPCSPIHFSNSVIVDKMTSLPKLFNHKFQMLFTFTLENFFPFSILKYICLVVWKFSLFIFL